jgi:hypothetical protein
MIRSFLQLQGLQSGVNPHGTVTLQLNLPETKYPKPESRTAFYDQLVPRLQAMAVWSAWRSPRICRWAAPRGAGRSSWRARP